MKNNEEVIQLFGFQMCDVVGYLCDFIDFILEGFVVLKNYKEGIDCVFVVLMLFGKGFDVFSELVNMNKEVLVEVEVQMCLFGFVVSEESVVVWKVYDEVGDKVGIIMKGLSNVIGFVLFLVLVQLGEWFVVIGLVVVVVIKGVIGGLVLIFWGLQNVVMIVFNLINVVVVQVVEFICVVVVVIWKVMNGDFVGVKFEFMNILKVWDQVWDIVFENIGELLCNV